METQLLSALACLVGVGRAALVTEDPCVPAGGESYRHTPSARDLQFWESFCHVCLKMWSLIGLLSNKSHLLTMTY